MGPEGAQKLARELQAMPARYASIDFSLCNLTGLDENGIGEDIDLDGYKAVCNILRRNKGISSINLAWNCMGFIAMPILKNVLQANQSLTILDLYKNDIKSEGMKILAPCFEQLSRLQKLNLRYNKIGPEGAEILAKRIPFLPDLLVLDVAFNLLGFDGLKILVPKIDHLRQLECVHLHENEGGLEGNCVFVEYILGCAGNLTEFNGLSVDELLTHVLVPEEKLPTRFENYEALYLAAAFAQVQDGDATFRFQMLYSFLLPHLDSIDLSYCNLIEFPESVLTLTCLKILDISFNNLAKIPVMKICALTSLTDLKCNGNFHLFNPPSEISEQGGIATLFYLKETLVSGIKDDELALVALGGESVGKSSCLSCLVTGVGRNTVKSTMASQSSEYEDGTPLFRGEPLFDPAMLDSVEELKAKPYRLNINDQDYSYLTGPDGTVVANMVYWRAANDLQFVIYDLPGHDFYSVTNRIFLKRRAVYLLVWRVSNYASDEAMARGMVSACRKLTMNMEMLQSTNPGASCLVVATHVDITDVITVAKQVKIVCTAIREKLAEMKLVGGGSDILKIFNDGYSSLLSCTTGEGVQNLRKDLIVFANSLEAFKAPHPKAFLQLRNGLRLIRNRHALLRWEGYVKLAKLCGLQGKELDVATRLLHARGYLVFFSDAHKTIRKKKSPMLFKTFVKIHMTTGGTLGKVRQQVRETKIETNMDDDNRVMITTSPHWLIRVFRGLLSPDSELLIAWFRGSIDAEFTNLSMVRATLNFLTNGVLERRLVHFLWPSLADRSCRAFWSAYADRGVGPLKEHEGDLVREEDDYDHIINILIDLRIISRLTASSFWVPCMQTGILGESALITDARVFKPFMQGLCVEIRFNFIPQDFFPVFMAFCLDIKDHFTKDRVQRIDFCSKAAALYLKGDKALISVSRAPRGGYYTLSLNASTFDFVNELHDKLFLAEHMYPGMIRMGHPETNGQIEHEEVSNVLFLFSLHAVPYTEILVEEVRKYDFSYKVTSKQVSQYSKMLALLSLSARDMIRTKHINTIGKLRAHASNHGVFSRDKLLRLGFEDADIKVIHDGLHTQSFHGQLAILCLDELYRDQKECDWYSVCTHVQAGAYFVLILLPGCHNVENLPVLPITVIDLRSASWIHDGRKIVLESKTELKEILHPLIQRLLANWRGVPQVAGDFEIPSVSCTKCLQEGTAHRQRFDFAQHLDAHNSFLKKQLKSADISLKSSQQMFDEPPIYCVEGHETTREEILCTTTAMSASACISCIEQGHILPHGFSRQNCLDVLHGKKTHNVPNHEEVAKGKIHGPTLACPQCKSEQLDLLDILQAELFVSYCKKKDFDPQVAAVEHLVRFVEEHLSIFAVKPSILYSGKDVTPIGGQVVLKAAKSARVFVAFMDSAYIKNSNCLAEFSAAVKMSRHIIPVLLPGYFSTSSNWWPADTKYKSANGVNMVAPFSVLKNFQPITLEIDCNTTSADQYEWELVQAVCCGLYGDVSHQQRISLTLTDWRMRHAAKQQILLGSWAKLETEDTDKKIARLWRRHGQSFDEIKNIRRELGNVGIKTSQDEITDALEQVSVALKTMGAAEFRQFVWNLMSNIMIKIEQAEAVKF